MNEAVATTATWRLREVSTTDRAGLDAITDLHMELLDYGPMAGLGGDFVREVCYRAHMDEGVLRVILGEVDGVPAGFVAVTPYSLSFHRSGLRRHAMLAAWETSKALVLDPRRLIRLLRALRVLFSRREELTRDAGPLGEVVCIAVRRQYLTGRFQRSAGVRVSELLVGRAAEYLRRAGIEDMRMLVDADNRPVLMLYHLLGAHFKGYSLGGEPAVEVHFDLRDGRLAAAAPACEAWVDGAPDSGDGGDRSAYGEESSDEQEVFRAEARDHVARLRRLVRPAADARVLDFGCGFGFAALELAPHVGTIALWDGSRSVRRRARIRVAHLPNVEFLDLSRSPEPPAAGPFDLITAHSVLQYMSEQEIARWLAVWRGLLSPSGRLVLSDLVQPQTSQLRERIDDLRFSARAGFFGNAIIGGVREIGHYLRARNTRPLTAVTPDRLAQWAGAADLRVEWLAENLSYRRLRRAAVLRLA